MTATRIEAAYPLRLLLPESRRHWTARYVLRRVRLLLWMRRHPDAPWLSPGAVEYLDEHLRPDDVLVEFGSGRSTAWFARRVARVISIEHDQTWAARVQAQVEAAGLVNAEVVHVPHDPLAYVSAAEHALASARANVILVDGVYRDTCALWALAHRSADGFIVVDDAERYVPARTTAPFSLAADTEPPTEAWRVFAARIAGLPQRRYQSGVTDTLVVWPR